MCSFLSQRALLALNMTCWQETKAVTPFPPIQLSLESHSLEVSTKKPPFPSSFIVTAPSVELSGQFAISAICFNMILLRYSWYESQLRTVVPGV